MATLGDCCLLASSPQEFKPTPPPYARNPNPVPEIRLPGLLRESLEHHSLPIFNPRGRLLGDLLIVQQLGGLLLEALDPRGMVQATDPVQKRIGTTPGGYSPPGVTKVACWTAAILI